MQEMRNWRTTAVCLVVAAVLSACASRGPRTPAPVEDRSSGARAPAAAPGEAPRPVAGADNAGKPGFYTVKPGDTLIRIALDAGQNWRDIARWNNLDNPNVIEVGQVLRVSPPTSTGTDVARNQAANTVARPVSPGASAPATGASAAASSTTVASI